MTNHDIGFTQILSEVSARGRSIIVRLDHIVTGDKFPSMGESGNGFCGRADCGQWVWDGTDSHELRNNDAATGSGSTSKRRLGIFMAQHDSMGNASVMG